MVTPDVIRNAAIESLQSGETFYAELRPARVARGAGAITHLESHPSAEVDANRIVVTSGGVSALMLAVQALVDAGDEAVIITPVWPNLVAQPTIMGRRCATCHCSHRAVPGAGLAWAAPDHHRAHAAADRECAQQPHGLDADA